MQATSLQSSTYRPSGTPRPQSVLYRDYGSGRRVTAVRRGARQGRWSAAPPTGGFSAEHQSLAHKVRAMHERAKGLEDTTLKFVFESSFADEAPGSEVAPAAWHHAEKASQALREMPNGWDGEDAPPASEKSQKRMLRVIRAISSDETVFPTLVPDYEGGIVAEWRAGQQSISIEVDVDGSAWAYATDEEGREILSTLLSFDQSVYVSIRFLSEVLASMSRRVSRLNPGWRSCFG